MKECNDFIEHVGWRNNPDKTIGVTWDAWCSVCGFKLENKPFASGMAIEGDGRRLELFTSFLTVDGIRYVSEKRKIICSECANKA